MLISFNSTNEDYTSEQGWVNFDRWDLVWVECLISKISIAWDFNAIKLGHLFVFQVNVMTWESEIE